MIEREPREILAILWLIIEEMIGIIDGSCVTRLGFVAWRGVGYILL